MRNKWNWLRKLFKNTEQTTQELKIMTNCNALNLKQYSQTLLHKQSTVKWMKITLEHEVTFNNVQNLRSMLTTIAMKDLSHKKHEHKDMSYTIKRNPISEPISLSSIRSNSSNTWAKHEFFYNLTRLHECYHSMVIAQSLFQVASSN